VKTNDTISSVAEVRMAYRDLVLSAYEHVLFSHSRVKTTDLSETCLVWASYLFVVILLMHFRQQVKRLLC
jgi:hypothetical protein